MRYLSVCSGIEAATQAWSPLGWEPAAFSEIEKFPRAVLSDHYPDVPLHGDFTTIKGDEYGPIDLLCGGTPCQSFSIAGLRGGMDDERGNLSLEFLKLAQRCRPRWLVWENVPGVLSTNGGRDFGAILGGLVELGYGFAYRVLDAQYARVDGFPRAVPQRRRRVVLIGHLGDARRAAAVLFERESLFGHTAPRRETGKSLAADAGAGAEGSCEQPILIDRAAFNQGQNAKYEPRIEHAEACSTIVSMGPHAVAHSLRRAGFDASEDGTGRGTPLIPEVCGSLTDGAHNGGGLNGQDAYTGRVIPVAFSSKDFGGDAMANVSPTLRAGNSDKSHANAGSSPAVAYDMRGRECGAQLEGPHRTANLRAASRGSSRSYVNTQMAVRRLTPIECERLMGFPDNFTQIPWRGKPADQCPDGPRYKALGNSWAVNVFRWVGQRIQMVEDMPCSS